MVEHSLVDWIWVVVIGLFGATMIIQGHFIYHGKHGYSRKDYDDQQKKNHVRKQVERVIKGK